MEFLDFYKIEHVETVPFRPSLLLKWSQSVMMLIYFFTLPNLHRLSVVLSGAHNIIQSGGRNEPSTQECTPSS